MSEQLQKQEWISFRVGAELYAHPVNQVREILEYTTPVPVPGSPEIVDGVLNVRGNIVTVLSCHRILEVEAPSNDNDNNIIIVDGSDGQFGISVDDVDAIVEIDKNEIMTNENGQDNGLVNGTVKHGKDLLILIDFDRFFGKMGFYE